MKLILGKLQRALQRHGVKASIAQLASVLHTLEDDGITLAPHQLSPETRARAIAAARAAKQAGRDPYEAFYDELIARALVELRGDETMRKEAEAARGTLIAGLLGA